MSFASGTRIGHYEIQSPLGAGGMGEVYRARDTRLGRDIALKVLPDSFAADPERIARFEREAQILAALSHPHIAAIYGLEISGLTRVLVMELVAGESLEARVRRGPLPLEEVLAIARQVGDALSAAHERGIVHRDLKPGNIMLTPDGSVKVLDFGLARMIEPDAAASGLSMSPTLSIHATMAGTILGTAPYMSPEQARGRAVDKRTDVWAFGCVLFEMLTATRAFRGDDLTETIAMIVKGDPDWTALDAAAPAHVATVVRGCLVKDPRQRFADIAVPLHLLSAGRLATSEPQAAVRVQQAQKLPWVIAAVATIALVAALGWIYATRSATPPPALATRFTIAPEKGTILTTAAAGGPQQVISPDGCFIAYVADDTEPGRARQVLWIRAIDSLTAQRLDNTAGATEPFWSPDSTQIAYFATGKIKRIPFTGGSAVTIADYKTSGVAGQRGGFWFRDANARDEGVIFWGDTGGTIQRVSASGGVVTPITALRAGEAAHSFPQILPGGRTLLFHSAGGTQEGIWAQDLKSGERTFLFPTTKRAVAAGPDLLLFMRDTTLFGQRWNWSTRKAAGEPVAVAENVRIATNNPRTTVSASLTGTVVFRDGGSSGGIVHRWYSIDGKAGEVVGRPGIGGSVEISPDGRWATAFANGNLELVDINAGTVAILATDVLGTSSSHWSPDSRRVLFTKADGTYQAVIGTGKTTLLYTNRQNVAVEISGSSMATSFVTDWTKDGLVVNINGRVGLIPAPDESASGPLPFKPTVLGEIEGDQYRVSPDGRWVAYSTVSKTQAGGFYRDVWIAAFPSLTNRRLVAGGTEPKWAADGRLLFGRQNVLYGVELKPGLTPEFGAPKELLRSQGMSMGGAGNVWGWAIMPDGKRVLARSSVAITTDAPDTIHVVLNWPALIK